ncbi:hypothetical protein DFH09DRAFT_1087350 [Mycena vulgaris]|nr:hypothetical protein DFH09DRAFT_1087350 [Mycena vulgaris]
MHNAIQNWDNEPMKQLGYMAKRGQVVLWCFLDYLGHDFVGKPPGDGLVPSTRQNHGGRFGQNSRSAPDPAAVRQFRAWTRPPPWLQRKGITGRLPSELITGILEATTWADQASLSRVSKLFHDLCPCLYRTDFISSVTQTTMR